MESLPLFHFVFIFLRSQLKFTARVEKFRSNNEVLFNSLRSLRHASINQEKDIEANKVG